MSSSLRRSVCGSALIGCTNAAWEDGASTNLGAGARHATHNGNSIAQVAPQAIGRLALERW
ncbi:MAG TPA: hypothetical protein VHB99_02600 [Pirellulales bacterium]|nr:hypothetical protein [Pirellulales bacterium]